MKALAKRGCEIHLLTRDEVNPAALRDGGLRRASTLSKYVESVAGSLDEEIQFTYSQRKFVSYWGIDRRDIAAVASYADGHRMDSVVTVGLDVLPYLAGIPKQGRIRRVWYAADEWFLHHVSQFRLTKPATWPEFKQGLIKGAYERAFAECVDRVWVVSGMDARATRWVMGAKSVDVIANGVDSQHFSRHELVRNVAVSQRDNDPSITFWGRLDFGPNLDAIDWFGTHVWSQLQKRHPSLRWVIYGFKPQERAEELRQRFGFELIANLPDLREHIVKHDLVVLPMVSGGGIKNKFLEAASLEMPIIASRRAVNGVELHAKRPCEVVKSPAQWLDVIRDLLRDADRRERLGSGARSFVEQHYTWEAAGGIALGSLESKREHRVLQSGQDDVHG